MSGDCQTASQRTLFYLWTDITVLSGTFGWFSHLLMYRQIWLVVHVTGGSVRLHLVVVTVVPSVSSFSFPSTLWIPLLLTVLGLVALSSSLSFSSPPPISPHVQHCAAPPTLLYPLFLLTPVSLHCSLNINLVRLGRTTRGSPHSPACPGSIFLHQGLKQKPHTHSVVALGGRYLLSFRQCQWFWDYNIGPAELLLLARLHSSIAKRQNSWLLAVVKRAFPWQAEA